VAICPRALKKLQAFPFQTKDKQTQNWMKPHYDVSLANSGQTTLSSKTRKLLFVEPQLILDLKAEQKTVSAMQYHASLSDLW